MSRRDDGSLFGAPLGCLVVAALLVILFGLMVWVIRWWWVFLVPDIFAGAVTAGLVPGALTVGQAQKIALAGFAIAAMEFVEEFFKKKREAARE